MTLRPNPLCRKRVTRVFALLRGDAGFGLIESVMAMTLLLIVASSLGGVLISSIASHKLSRERSLADTAVLTQLEKIRATPYSSVGTPGGNPPGTIPASTPITLRGGNATLDVRVQYVNDPTPTSYNTLANYKRVTITVTRDSDNKELARQVTFVAPDARDPYSGINQSGVAATVVDMGSNTPVPDVTVALGTGPSAPRTDTTDEAGQVTFAGLAENPLSGAQQYYDLTVTPPSGYAVLSDDQSPAAAAHVSLGPGQTFNTALRIYQPSSIIVNLTDAGVPYAGTGTTTLTVTWTRASTPHTATYTTAAGASTYTIPNLVPGVDYTVSATTSDGLEANPVTKTVPNAYPTDLTSVYSLPLFRPTGTVNVSATRLGIAAAGATITLTGGPNSISLSGTADASGVATFINVPNGAGYTFTATLGATSGTQTGSIAPHATTNVAVVITVPMGSIKANVKRGAANISGAAVTITGGPYNVTVNGTTDSSGNFTGSVPAGTGYTVTATSILSATATAVAVTAGATTNVNLVIPTNGTIKTIVKMNAVVVPGATVTINGGPSPPNLPAPNTDSTGTSSVAAATGTGYTVTVNVYGVTVTSASQTVTNGATTTVNIVIPIGTFSVTGKHKNAGVCVVNNSTVTTFTVTGPGGYTAGPFTSNTSGFKSITAQPAGVTLTFTATWSTPTKTGTQTGTVTSGGTTTMSVSTPLSDGC
jgi:hypothetical protein